MSQPSPAAAALPPLPSLVEAYAQRFPQETQLVREGVAAGQRFFDAYHRPRLALALESMSAAMRHALYETLFLLHCNDPALQQFRFALADGSSASLHLEGAPAGIQGLEQLDPSFSQAYAQHIEQQFGMDAFPTPQPGSTAKGAPAKGWAPIVMVQSVGSVGSVSYKPQQSDLDLQVMYDAMPLSWHSERWDAPLLRESLRREQRWWVQHLCKTHHLHRATLEHDEALATRLNRSAEKCLAQAYPHLTRSLLHGDGARNGDAWDDAAWNDGAWFAALEDDPPRLRAVLLEIARLIRRTLRLNRKLHTNHAETLLLRRIQHLQRYLDVEHPQAEVYLFAYSVDGFKQGHYASSLDLKESSGAAYELILNYETLMPGVQYTPLIPSHFLMPLEVNDTPQQFEALIDLWHLGAFDRAFAGGSAGAADGAADAVSGGVEGARLPLLDVGPAPNLDPLYVARHGGAIYWEAFKATTGNLPKALLQLLRFEMLLDARFTLPIIRLLRQPEVFDHLALPRPEGEMRQIGEQAALGQMKTGLPGWQVLELERQFLILPHDPWWMRYKVLKLVFAHPEGINELGEDERRRLSFLIDINFALHLRIADVMPVPEDDAPNGAKRSPPPFVGNRVRHAFLSAFLDRAFPPHTPSRIHLENLLNGSMAGVSHFDAELRNTLRRLIVRVESKLSALGVRELVAEGEELRLWLNHYTESFQRPENAVPSMVLKHLRAPRPCIEVGHHPEAGWTFFSKRHPREERPLVVPSRLTPYLPDRVPLLENPSFLKGLAACVRNRYFDRVLLHGQQVSTIMEIDVHALQFAGELDRQHARLTEGGLNRLMMHLQAFFPPLTLDYRTVLHQKRHHRDIFVLLNLLRFGQLEVLYRDHLDEWYVDTYQVPEMISEAEKLVESPQALLGFWPLHQKFAAFLAKRRIDPGEVRFAAWVNPASVRQQFMHRPDEITAELEGGESFLEQLLRFYRDDP